MRLTLPSTPADQPALPLRALNFVTFIYSDHRNKETIYYKEA